MGGMAAVPTQTNYSSIPILPRSNTTPLFQNPVLTQVLSGPVDAGTTAVPTGRLGSLPNQPNYPAGANAMRFQSGQAAQVTGGGPGIGVADYVSVADTANTILGELPDALAGNHRMLENMGGASRVAGRVFSPLGRAIEVGETVSTVHGAANDPTLTEDQRNARAGAAVLGTTCSVAGSIVGGALVGGAGAAEGAAEGGAVGSVVPGVGTAGGAAVGAVVRGAIGTMAGAYAGGKIGSQACSPLGDTSFGRTVGSVAIGVDSAATTVGTILAPAANLLFSDPNAAERPSYTD